MDGSSLYTQKRMVATTGHTQMALRILDDGKEDQIQMTENLAMDIVVYQFSQGLGDETIFSNYVAGNYDSSADYWKRTWGGQLVNDGSGWLRDENGKYINIDGTLSDEPIPGQTLGATGIETGLLNILEGTSSQGYNTFSDEQVLAAQKLMMDAGMSPTNPNASFRDRAWGWKKGHKLDMNDFMETAGESVPDSIFDAYYNNTVDSQLAKAWNIDLGFERKHEIPEVLQDKYSDLVTRHLQETGSPAALEAKYKFTVYDEDGVATELFKLTEDNPFLDDLLKQGDSVFDNLEYMQKYGCNFMATIAYPQLLTGNVLNEKQITEIWNEAGKDNSIFNITSDEKIGEGTVHNPNLLAGKVYDYLDKSNLTSVFGGEGSSNMIGVKLKLKYGENSCHFVTGSSTGSILYNPGWTVSDILRKDNVYLFAN